MGKVKSWLFRNLPWIFIITGILMLFAGHVMEPKKPVDKTTLIIPGERLNQREPENKEDTQTQQYPDAAKEQNWFDGFLHILPRALQGAGTAVLASGIFTAVLKSFQFTGIFQEELAKVLYGSEYLAGQDRKFIEQMWKSVSKALYTKKFPSLDNKIEEVIMKTYLPSDHKFYFKDFRLWFSNIEITNEGGEDYVSYDHMVKGRIIPIEDGGKFKWINRYEVKNDKNSIRKILLFKLELADGTEQDLTEDLKVASASKKSFLETELDCQLEYMFTKIEKRKFRLSIPPNEIQRFEISKVTDGMIVNYDYNPEAVRVTFINKTVNDFLPVEESESLKPKKKTQQEDPAISKRFWRSKGKKKAAIAANEIGEENNEKDESEESKLLDLNRNNGRRIVVKEYTGILLPSQGFCLVLSNIKK